MHLLGKLALALPRHNIYLRSTLSHSITEGVGGMRIRLSAIARLARSATVAHFIGTPYNKLPPTPHHRQLLQNQRSASAYGFHLYP